MVFKQINQCIGLSFKFTCPYLECEPCNRSVSENKDAKLKGEKRSSCAFRRKIRFVDSLLFTNASMANMVKDMHVVREKTNLSLQDTFPRTYTYMMDEGHDESTFELVCNGKLDFPYERVTTWSAMEQKQIPSRTDFASSLRDTNDLSPERYSEFCNTWRKLKIKNLADLLRIYNILGKKKKLNKKNNQNQSDHRKNTNHSTRQTVMHKNQTIQNSYQTNRPRTKHRNDGHNH